MATEVRAVTTDEIRAFHDISSYVFGQSRENHERHLADGLEGYFGPMGLRAAFVDGEMATTLAWHRIRIALNGPLVPLGAVTAVGTLPQFRRQGLLRRVMERSLADIREEGHPLAMLWASMGAIYQRFGYGLASHYVGYRIDPRGMTLREPRAWGGSVRLVTPDAARGVMERLYTRYLEGRTLLIERPDRWWDHRLLEVGRHAHRSHVAVALDAAQEPRGYALYRTAEDMHVDFEPGGDQSMVVQDLVALDLDAHLALWEFLRGHDLVKQAKFEHVAEDDPIVDLLLEPRELRRQTGDGMWLRVVDVARALEARGYDEDGTVTLGVRDGFCAWNDGTYRLRVDGGVGRVERVEGGAEVTMPVAALASMLSGFRSATHLARAGRAEGEAEALRRADRLFATAYRPRVMDGF